MTADHPRAQTGCGLPLAFRPAPSLPSPLWSLPRPASASEQTPSWPLLSVSSAVPVQILMGTLHGHSSSNVTAAREHVLKRRSDQATCSSPHKSLNSLGCQPRLSQFQRTPPLLPSKRVPDKTRPKISTPFTLL